MLQACFLLLGQSLGLLSEVVQRPQPLLVPLIGSPYPDPEDLGEELHGLVPLGEPDSLHLLAHSVFQQLLDDPAGVLSEVGQPLQLAQGRDGAGKGLEHRGCSAEGDVAALTAVEVCCLRQRLQSLREAGIVVREGCGTLAGIGQHPHWTWQLLPGHSHLQAVPALHGDRLASRHALREPAYV